MKNHLSIIVFLLFAMMLACSDDDTTPGDNCDGLTVSFSTDILPVIQSSCATNASCHASGALQPVFETYADIKPFADNGILRLQVVTTKAMPQGSSLSQSQIDNFDCWIADGAPDN